MNFWYLALAELMGTMVLIIFGNGVVYSVSAKRMFANQPGKWVVICLAWGFAVFFGVITSTAIYNRLGGGAHSSTVDIANAVNHLNPAVTIFAAISDKKAILLGLIPFQFFGAIIGQIILNFINWKHIGETELGVVRSAHCTGPAFGNKEKAKTFNFSYELVGTLLLLGIILAFGKANIDQLGPLSVAFLVMVIGMSLGSSTGYAINPARDLGPRIVYFITEKFFLKKRKSEFVGANWSYAWVPVVAPSVAGVIIGLLGLA